MSFRTVGQRLKAVLEAAIGGTPDLNAADGSDTLRRDLTAAEVHYGSMAILQPFPNIWIQWTGSELIPKMEAGTGQTRVQRFDLWLVSNVSGEEPSSSNTDTEGQIANAEQDIEILAQNLVKVLMGYVQDGANWYLLTFGDLAVSDEYSEDGFWVKAGRLPVSVELDYSSA